MNFSQGWFSYQIPRPPFIQIDSQSDFRSSTVDFCYDLLNWLLSNGKEVVLQWIPAHCGVQGNEAADFLAKKGASVLQTTQPGLPYHSIKSIVRKAFRASFFQELIFKNRNKPWIEQIREMPEWPRKKSVAIFRLISGHDCLRKHLYRINVTPDSFCTLCDLKEDMDLLHLRRCPALPHTSIWERYWVARAALSL